MTPLPRPHSGTRRMRRDNPIPMTSSQYLHWSRTRAPANDNDPSLTGTPFRGDSIRATDLSGQPDDDVDAGFLAAVRVADMKVGLAAGEVPDLVAFRLFLKGWVEVAPPK